MSKRKLFQNLSKSQKNRRIKKEYDSFLEIPSSSPWQSKKSSMENVIIEEGNTENVELCSNLKIMRSENEKCNSSGEISSVKKDIKDNNTLDSNNDMLMEDNAILEPFNISENNSNALKEELTRWICQYNIAHLAAGALLKILRNVQSIEELKELPQDPRTLLNTPRSTVIRLVSPGEYFHYGLQQGLIDQLKVMNKNKLAENIQINVHIDGLPLAKSSKSQLYPILAEIFPKITAPFVVGIYHGYSKPHSVNEYLQEFIEEYNTLQKEGFQYDDRTFHVIIRAVICDSPARSFVTCTKSHNGFFGCSKCMQEGEFEDHRMLFLEMDAPLRTDNNFLQRKNEDHHTGKSIFEASNIGMVSQFPVEYMHLVCLGVEKKILHLWVNGWRISNKKQIKFSAKIINKISKYLISIRNWIPSEFVRKTRSLDELDRWKATELRLFLLYVGPLALKNHQPDEYLYHFNSLHCAIRLLCDETDCIRNNQCANNLLRYFVEQSINLYGKRFVIYNVHNLIHLADDVKRFGHLDSFSAFSFESYLNKIKKHLKKGEKPLQQLHKRLVEQASSSSLRRNCVFIKPEVSRKWPPKDENATKDSMKAVKPKDNWVSVKYTRLLGPYDNYKTARAIEIAAVDLSTNDETPLENITNKAEVSKRRPRKRPARFISSDDGSSDEIETDRTRNNKNALKPIFVYESNSKKQENPVKIKANELENASTLPKVMNIINDKNKQYKNDNNNTYNDDDLLDTQPLDYGNFFDDHPIEIEPKNSDCDSQLPTNNKPLVRSVVKTHIPIYVTSKEKSRSYKVLTPRNTATKCTTTPVRLFEQNATTTNEVSEQGATTSTMQVPEQEVITTVTKEFSTPSHQSCCQKKNPDHRW